MEIIVCRTGPFLVNTLIVPLSDEVAFVVDPGGNVADIMAALERAGLSPVAIVLTHGHFDHVLGLSEFRKRCPMIPVVIHQADSGYLGTIGKKRQQDDLYAFGLERRLTSLVELPFPDVLLAEGDTLAKIPCLATVPAATEWHILHTPGHTPGSICIHNVDENTLISGDTLFCGGYGRTDLYGGNEADILCSLARLRELPAETRIYPGHDTYGFMLGDYSV